MRKPRNTKSPFQRGKPGSSAPSNPDGLPPIFSFEHMKDGSGYSVNCCNDSDRSALAKRLFLLSRTNWRDIRQSPRHGIGTETIAQSAVNPALPNAVTDDVTILALRYNGKKPIVGYRDERVFHVLFIDHNFSVYKHG